MAKLFTKFKLFVAGFFTVVGITSFVGTVVIHVFPDAQKDNNSAIAGFIFIGTLCSLSGGWVLVRHFYALYIVKVQIRLTGFLKSHQNFKIITAAKKIGIKASNLEKLLLEFVGQSDQTPITYSETKQEYQCHFNRDAFQYLVICPTCGARQKSPWKQNKLECEYCGVYSQPKS